MGINFNDLLKPYEEGGVIRRPVKRSLSTIASTLIYKNKLPPDVVGAAILNVFTEMAEKGLEFKGDGKYGSRGRELFRHIKEEAVKLAQNRAVEDVFLNILEEKSCLRADCPLRTKEMRGLSRWNRFRKFMLKPRVWWTV